MRSDNGTNLVRAERELKETIQGLNHTQIQNNLLNKDIHWILKPTNRITHGGISYPNSKYNKNGPRKFEMLSQETLSSSSTTLLQEACGSWDKSLESCQIQKVSNGKCKCWQKLAHSADSSLSWSCWLRPKTNCNSTPPFPPFTSHKHTNTHCGLYTHELTRQKRDKRKRDIDILYAAIIVMNNNTFMCIGSVYICCNSHVKLQGPECWRQNYDFDVNHYLDEFKCSVIYSELDSW